MTPPRASRAKQGGRTHTIMFVCGPSRDYFYGNPRPPQERGYFYFIECQEVQLRKRRRPRTVKTP